MIWFFKPTPFKENVKYDVATFTAHLSVTIKTLTRYKQKSSFGRHVGGQEYTLQHGGRNDTTSLKNQSIIKYLT